MEIILWMICFLPLSYVFVDMVERENKKATLLLAISIIASIALCICANERETSHHNVADNLIEIVDMNDLTIEDLQSRNGKIIIERVVGVVDNAETGSGHVVGNENYYISYNEVQGISNGDMICTYFIYNPETNWEDDIIFRFDYIVESGSL